MGNVQITCTKKVSVSIIRYNVKTQNVGHPYGMIRKHTDSSRFFLWELVLTEKVLGEIIFVAQGEKNQFGVEGHVT